MIEGVERNLGVDGGMSNQSLKGISSGEGERRTSRSTLLHVAKRVLR